MAYRAPASSDWPGRIDSLTDYDAFRWHQVITLVSLDTYPETNPHGFLAPGQVGIGFVGFACDEGIKRNKGRQGAALGPRMLRKELANLPCLFEPRFKLFDCGDIVHSKEDLESLQRELAQAVKKIVALGLFPIVLGGGHELARGHFLGLAPRYPDLAIVNFDAHLDMRPYPEGPSSGTMFLQIADDLNAQGKPFKYLCLGLQRRGNTIALLKSAKAHGGSFRYARDMIHEPLALTNAVVDDFCRGQSAIYATLCTDVISSAYAPGVSAAQPLGLHPEMVLALIKRLVSTGKLIAFDVAEVSPRYDQDNVTANLASTFIFGLVNEIARIKGCFIDI